MTSRLPQIQTTSLRTPQTPLFETTLRGIRLGFDVVSRIKSLKLDINKDNNTVSLPDDYVDVLKLGVVDSDGVLRVWSKQEYQLL